MSATTHRLVIDFQDARPAWRVPEAVVGRIADALPASWEVTVVRSPTEGTGDGAGGASDEALAAVSDAEVYLGFGVAPEILRAGPGLR
ncbi:MAG: hypothetical protein ACODAE_09755, partial [Gemmatimonadota bacterium]